MKHQDLIEKFIHNNGVHKTLGNVRVDYDKVYHYGTLIATKVPLPDDKYIVVIDEKYKGYSSSTNNLITLIIRTTYNNSYTDYIFINSTYKYKSNKYIKQDLYNKCLELIEKASKARTTNKAIYTQALKEQLTVHNYKFIDVLKLIYPHKRKISDVELKSLKSKLIIQAMKHKLELWGVIIWIVQREVRLLYTEH